MKQLKLKPEIEAKLEGIKEEYPTIYKNIRKYLEKKFMSDFTINEVNTMLMFLTEINFEIFNFYFLFDYENNDD